MLDDYPGGWFGKSWGAPVCEPARHKATPTHLRCTECRKKFEIGDQGLIIPFVPALGKPVQLTGMHIACFCKDLPKPK